MRNFARKFATYVLVFGVGSAVGVAANAIAGTTSNVVETRVQLALIALLGVLAALGGASITAYTARRIAAEERRTSLEALREEQFLATRLKIATELASVSRKFQDAVEAQVRYREQPVERRVGGMPKVDQSPIWRVSELADQLRLMADQASAEAAASMVDPMLHVYTFALESMSTSDRSKAMLGLGSGDGLAFEFEVGRLEKARLGFQQRVRDELGLPLLKN